MGKRSSLECSPAANEAIIKLGDAAGLKKNQVTQVMIWDFMKRFGENPKALIRLYADMLHSLLQDGPELPSETNHKILKRGGDDKPQGVNDEPNSSNSNS